MCVCLICRGIATNVGSDNQTSALRGVLFSRRPSGYVSAIFECMIYGGGGTHVGGVRGCWKGALAPSSLRNSTLKGIAARAARRKHQIRQEVELKRPSCCVSVQYQRRGLKLAEVMISRGWFRWCQALSANQSRRHLISLLPSILHMLSKYITITSCYHPNGVSRPFRASSAGFEIDSKTVALLSLSCLLGEEFSQERPTQEMIHSHGPISSRDAQT